MCIFCTISNIWNASAPSQSAPAEAPAAKPYLSLSGVESHIARYAWNIDETKVLTYGFRASDASTGFVRLTSDQIKAAANALHLWADVANIAIQRVGHGSSGNGAYSNDATILFSGSNQAFTPGMAWTFSPGSPVAGSLDGDVFLNVSTHQFDDITVGSYANMAIIHEVGHALGLSHPGAYNGGMVSYAHDAEYAQDTRQYTLMSYFSETNTGGDFKGLQPATPMLDDIAAIQSIYGANWKTRAGDTVYGFHSTAGRAEFALHSAADKPVFAIWDGGGADTVDFSGYDDDQLINLRAGTFSNVGGLTGNVAIARHAVIENAIGGAGDDVLLGNTTANILRGGAGNDTIKGYGGDDRIIYDSGLDSIDGGAGRNVADFRPVAAGVWVSLAGSGAWLRDGADPGTPGTKIATLTHIADVAGTAFDDHIEGSSAANILRGNGGNDELAGGSGNDILYGGAGADVLDGGNGFDRASYYASAKGVVVDLADPSHNQGEAAGDVFSSVEGVVGSSFADTIIGDAGDNQLSGHRGNDRLEGGGGNDMLDGGSGDDVLIGGAGDDTYLMTSARDAIVETAAGGVDLVRSRVSITLPDHVELGELSGNAKASLTGNDDDNVLHGNARSNVIAGLGGRDILRGGGGADVFRYEHASDSGANANLRDVIQDFRHGTDRIDVHLLAEGDDFVWRSDSQFTGDTLEVRYQVLDGSGDGPSKTVVFGDVNGDGHADFQIELAGVHHLSAHDFLF